MMVRHQNQDLADAGFKREAITVNGVKVLMLTSSKGDPILVLHGVTFIGFAFAVPWTAKYRVMIPYHPGFGESDDAPHFLQMHDYVMRYLELMDQLKLNRVKLVGCSFGGWLAAEFAMEHSDRVDKLVLVSPTGLAVPDHPSADVFMIRPEELASYLVSDPNLLTPFLPSSPDPDFATARYREQTTLARIAWERPFSNALPRWLHRVRSPTLVVWGEDDRLTPIQQAKIWADMIPRSKLKTVKEAGHLVLEEKPEAVKAIADFLG